MRDYPEQDAHHNRQRNNSNCAFTHGGSGNGRAEQSLSQLSGDSNLLLPTALDIQTTLRLSREGWQQSLPVLQAVGTAACLPQLLIDKADESQTVQPSAEMRDATQPEATLLSGMRDYLAAQVRNGSQLSMESAVECALLSVQEEKPGLRGLVSLQENVTRQVVKALLAVARAGSVGAKEALTILLEHSSLSTETSNELSRFGKENERQEKQIVEAIMNAQRRAAARGFRLEHLPLMALFALKKAEVSRMEPAALLRTLYQAGLEGNRKAVEVLAMVACGRRPTTDGRSEASGSTAVAAEQAAQHLQQIASRSEEARKQIIEVSSKVYGLYASGESAKPDGSYLLHAIANVYLSRFDDQVKDASATRSAVAAVLRQMSTDAVHENWEKRYQPIYTYLLARLATGVAGHAIAEQAQHCMSFGITNSGLGADDRLQAVRQLMAVHQQHGIGGAHRLCAVMEGQARYPRVENEVVTYLSRYVQNCKERFSSATNLSEKVLALQECLREQGRLHRLNTGLRADTGSEMLVEVVPKLTAPAQQNLFELISKFPAGQSAACKNARVEDIRQLAQLGLAVARQEGLTDQERAQFRAWLEETMSGFLVAERRQAGRAAFEYFLNFGYSKDDARGEIGHKLRRFAREHMQAYPRDGNFAYVASRVTDLEKPLPVAAFLRHLGVSTADLNLRRRLEKAIARHGEVHVRNAFINMAAWNSMTPTARGLTLEPKSLNGIWRKTYALERAPLEEIQKLREVLGKLDEQGRRSPTLSAHDLIGFLSGEKTNERKDVYDAVCSSRFRSPKAISMELERVLGNFKAGVEDASWSIRGAMLDIEKSSGDGPGVLWHRITNFRQRQAAGFDNLAEAQSWLKSITPLLVTLQGEKQRADLSGAQESYFSYTARGQRKDADFVAESALNKYGLLAMRLHVPRLYAELYSRGPAAIDAGVLARRSKRTTSGGIVAPPEFRYAAKEVWQQGIDTLKELATRPASEQNDRQRLYAVEAMRTHPKVAQAFDCMLRVGAQLQEFQDLFRIGYGGSRSERFQEEIRDRVGLLRNSLNELKERCGGGLNELLKDLKAVLGQFKEQSEEYKELLQLRDFLQSTQSILDDWSTSNDSGGKAKKGKIREMLRIVESSDFNASNFSNWIKENGGHILLEVGITTALFLATGGIGAGLRAGTWAARLGYAAVTSARLGASMTIGNIVARETYDRAIGSAYGHPLGEALWGSGWQIKKGELVDGQSLWDATKITGWQLIESSAMNLALMGFGSFVGSLLSRQTTITPELAVRLRIMEEQLTKVSPATRGALAQFLEEYMSMLKTVGQQQGVATGLEVIGMGEHAAAVASAWLLAGAHVPGREIRLNKAIGEIAKIDSSVNTDAFVRALRAAKLSVTERSGKRFLSYKGNALVELSQTPPRVESRLRLSGGHADSIDGIQRGRRPWDWARRNCTPAAQKLLALQEEKWGLEYEQRYLEKESSSPGYKDTNGVDAATRANNRARLLEIEREIREIKPNPETERLTRQFDAFEAIGQTELAQAVELNFEIARLSAELENAKTTASDSFGTRLLAANLDSLQYQLENMKLNETSQRLVQQMIEKYKPLIDFQSEVMRLRQEAAEDPTDRVVKEKLAKAERSLTEAKQKFSMDKSVVPIRVAFGDAIGVYPAGEFVLRNPADGSRVKLTVEGSVPKETAEDLLAELDRMGVKPTELRLTSAEQFQSSGRFDLYSGLVSVRLASGETVNYLATLNHEIGHLIDLRLLNAASRTPAVDAIWRKVVTDNIDQICRIAEVDPQDRAAKAKLLDEILKDPDGKAAKSSKARDIARYMVSRPELLAEMYALYVEKLAGFERGESLTYSELVDRVTGRRDERASAMHLFETLFTHVEKHVFEPMMAERQANARVAARLASQQIELMRVMQKYGCTSKEFSDACRQVGKLASEQVSDHILDALFVRRYGLDPAKFDPAKLPPEQRRLYEEYKKLKQADFDPSKAAADLRQELTEQLELLKRIEKTVQTASAQRVDTIVERVLRDRLRGLMAQQMPKLKNDVHNTWLAGLRKLDPSGSLSKPENAGKLAGVSEERVMAELFRLWQEKQNLRRNDPRADPDYQKLLSQHGSGARVEVLKHFGDMFRKLECDIFPHLARREERLRTSTPR